MKRSGFLKALGVMLAAPSVIAAIPATEPVKKIPDAFRNTPKGINPMGGYAIEDCLIHGDSAEIYVSGDCPVRARDLIVTVRKEPNRACQSLVTKCMQTYPKQKYLVVHTIDMSVFEHDGRFFRLSNAVSEHS